MRLQCIGPRVQCLVVRGNIGGEGVCRLDDLLLHQIGTHLHDALALLDGEGDIGVSRSRIILDEGFMGHVRTTPVPCGPVCEHPADRDEGEGDDDDDADDEIPAFPHRALASHLAPAMGRGGWHGRRFGAIVPGFVGIEEIMQVVGHFKTPLCYRVHDQEPSGGSQPPTAGRRRLGVACC